MVDLVTMLGVISTPGSSTGTSRGVSEAVGLGVRVDGSVEVAEGTGERVGMTVADGFCVVVSDGNGMAVQLGVAHTDFFSVAAPRQAVPTRQRINRQKINERFK